MKPAVLAQRLAPLMPVMRCPRCRSAFALNGASLVCQNRHTYDLSRRGYVNLAPSHDQNAEKYDAVLFDSRRLVFEHGFYLPVAEAIASALPHGPVTVLDAGCGEGYYTRLLAERFPQAQFIGLDISRDAVTAAAREQSPASWMVADLKHLPFADDCADVLLDVLTPANYDEFRRILSPDGLLIKVYPGSGYLRELRTARGLAPYEEGQVDAYLREKAAIMVETRVTVTHTISDELWRDFVWMTPLMQDLSAEEKNAVAAKNAGSVTIDLHVAACRLT